nr:hypothetical protein [Fischerella sp. PCC 9605]
MSGRQKNLLCATYRTRKKAVAANLRSPGKRVKAKLNAPKSYLRLRNIRNGQMLKLQKT